MFDLRKLSIAILILTLLLTQVAAIGPLPSEAVYIAFIVAVLAFIKFGESKGWYELPEGWYTKGQAILSGFYAVLVAFAAWAPVDIDIAWLEPALVAATDFLTALLGLVSVFVGGKLFYELCVWLKIPLLGYSRSRS